MAIVLVITGYGTESFESPREEDYRSLAAYYGIPAISVVPEVRRRIAAGEFSCRDILTDGTHPNDRGYALYCDIIFEQLMNCGDSGPWPEKPLTANRFESARMIELASLLPPAAPAAAWRRELPSVTGRLVRSPAVALASERHRSGAGNGLPLSGNRVFRCRRLLRDGSGRRPVRASGRRGEHICRRHEIPLAVSGAREPFSTAARCGKAYDYSESARPEPAAGLSAADRTVNRLE